MNRGFIERGWQSYRTHCVPNDATDSEVKERREAFFAGASILFTGITNYGLDETREPTEEDLRLIQVIQDEVNEFGLQLDLRYLAAAGLS